MAQKYVMRRSPLDIYELHIGVKTKLEDDIYRASGKRMKLSMPDLHWLLANPRTTKVFEMNINEIIRLLEQRRRR